MSESAASPGQFGSALLADFERAIDRLETGVGDAGPRDGVPGRRRSVGNSEAIIYLLETRGVRSGRRRTTPVTLMEDEGRWLVAPYGVRAWVRTVRASREGRLLRGRRTLDVRFGEADVEQAAPVLQRYWQQVTLTRPYFDVGTGPELADFRRVAPSHPVFRVIG